MLPNFLPKKKRWDRNGFVIEDPELIGSTQGPEDYPIDLPQLQKPTEFDIDPEKEMALESLPNLQDDEEQLEPLQELGALAELKRHIANRPKREQYKQGLGKTLLSGLAAALTGYSSGDAEKGARVGLGMKDREFNRATEDWEMEGGKLKDLATIEERSNLGKENIRVRRETAAESARQRDVAEKRHREGLDETKRYHDVLDKNADATRESTAESRRATIAAMGNRKLDRKGEILAKDEDSARAEYQKRTANHDEARDTIQKVRELSKLKGSVAELSELMSMIHSIDKTAAREGEVNTQREARSLGEKVKLWESRNIGGKSIAVTPEMRKEILNAAEAMAAGMETSRKKIQGEYSELSKRRGYDIRNIVLDYNEDENSESEFERWRKRQ